MQGALARALQLKRWTEVERLVMADSESEPSERMRLLAVARLNLGRPEEAYAAIQAATEFAPQSAPIWTNRGSILRTLGRLHEAADAFERAAALDPTLAAPCFNLGKLLSSDARLRAAREPLLEATRRDPKHVEAWCALGRVEVGLGNVTAAIATFRRALALRPTTGAAWWGLANLKTVAFDRADQAQLDALWVQPNIGADDRTLIGFARAHAHLANGEDATGWRALLDANALKRSHLQWDLQRHRNWVDDVIRLWQQPRQPAGDPARGSNVIFILGLPRSGSTLLEQVLAAHSLVSAASELPDLQQVLRSHSPKLDARELAACSTEDFAALGTQYLQRTERWRAERPWMVDKMPANFLHIGAIRLMLPGAHIIDMRRDLRDCAYSCFLQHFAHTAPWSNDLAELKAWCADYERLMQHWLAFDGDAVIRVHYEALVASPEHVTTSLLEAIGLPWEPGCCQPHEVNREVRTASAAQVREPMDQRGRGRWRRFESVFSDWPS
ncbi:hypothetical protein C7S18_10375 [Ahniella affigens]|uniref:Uncharacterized protein n=1 Tax=Ahniella affigens TaxID=2021234 RepID=A0A2P1PRU8_9GAMM|nr:sulfotransferase [Ahniella affigens]AVP97576.1 hypothetical protein C7S18_10375 [Ahniella affigens]